ncbi:MAG: hypothetical protein Q9M45_11835 [Robiginitomaculum sp.]|nr:hypothetical protein [Robiginitomaculum sp.]
MVYGTITNPKLNDINDMVRREVITFAPLVVLTILFGLWPSLVTDFTGPAVEALVEHIATIAPAMQ